MLLVIKYKYMKDEVLECSETEWGKKYCRISHTSLISHFSPPMLLPFFLSHLASVHPGILSISRPARKDKKEHTVGQYYNNHKVGFILRHKLIQQNGVAFCLLHNLTRLLLFKGAGKDSVFGTNYCMLIY